MKLKSDAIFLFVVASIITYVQISGYVRNPLFSAIAMVATLVIFLYMAVMNAIYMFPQLRDKNNGFTRWYNKRYGEES